MYVMYDIIIITSEGESSVIVLRNILHENLFHNLTFKHFNQDCGPVCVYVLRI